MAGYEVSKLRFENDALRQKLLLAESTIKTMHRLNLEYRKQVAELSRMLRVSVHHNHRQKGRSNGIE